jgi:hypothetical protein
MKLKEEFKDTKGIIGIHKLNNDRKHNGHHREIITVK